MTEKIIIKDKTSRLLLIQFISNSALVPDTSATICSWKLCQLVRKSAVTPPHAVLQAELHFKERLRQTAAKQDKVYSLVTAVAQVKSAAMRMTMIKITRKFLSSLQLSTSTCVTSSQKNELCQFVAETIKTKIIVCLHHRIVKADAREAFASSASRPCHLMTRTQMALNKTFPSLHASSILRTMQTSKRRNSKRYRN